MINISESWLPKEKKSYARYFHSLSFGMICTSCRSDRGPSGAVVYLFEHALCSTCPFCTCHRFIYQQLDSGGINNSYDYTNGLYELGIIPPVAELRLAEGGRKDLISRTCAHCRRLLISESPMFIRPCIVFSLQISSRHCQNLRGSYNIDPPKPLQEV